VAGLREMLGAERAVGTFVKLPSTAVIDLAAEAADFVVIDREHAPLSESDALALVRHASALGLPAVVRLPALDAGQVNRLLEAGAAGIQLSTVRRPDEVAALRAACEYSPRGARSISLAHPVARFGAVGLRDHVHASAGAALVIVQLETVETDATYDRVLAAGPDVAFIGTADLLVSAGFDEDLAAERYDAISAAAATHGVTLGAFGRADDPAVRYLLLGSDLAMLRDGMTRALTPTPMQGAH